MKNYYMVILKTGTYIEKDTAKRNVLFRGHMNNISQMVKDGKLIVAGPFGKNDLQFRGVFIFDVKTKDEVEKLLENDPTVKTGFFVADIIPWYGSAALSVYLKTHSLIEKQKH